MADVVGLKTHAHLFRRGGGLAPPSDVVLSWPAPNYIDPETHGDAGPIFVILFLALSILTYLARMWARVVVSKNAGLDDWIMTAAIMPLIGAAIAVILVIFSCSPVEGYWHYFDISWRLTHELKCHNEGAQIVTVVVISTLQDFFLCTLPIVLIWNLQISKRQKAGLCGIFGLGLLTCVCGVMRAYYAVYVYYYTYDITWYAWYGWIWTALEAQLGVMCACAPALKGFFKKYFSLNSTRSGAYGYGTRHPKSSGGRIPGYGKFSPENSLVTSNVEGSKWEPVLVPMNRIKVSTTTNIVEDRDERVSIGSNSSTKNLTALPSTALPLPVHNDERLSNPSIWNGNRTVITAYRHDKELDIEKHAHDA
ncbi:uncharacterized protein N0V89_000476 [Didymosphaeria variabile]|uniref:Rhodopsin domain-containing protein n=1 Tax=Didymosphaeria variabile TaxID=1932322 RepID=A0A9W8XUC4_9PLEO|nr:uncharacterized protein N0V89_000476 [Didymosphaeria variabile]KAJ4359917.1 hypothetical protein N0V89_000476 [Didymosphaeria variabile]